MAPEAAILNLKSKYLPTWVGNKACNNILQITISC